MDFKDLKLIWLIAFVEAAETESFSKASKVLGVDKSSVSRYVSKLEEWYQSLLFYQNSVPLELTAEGQAFVPKAREVLRLLKEASATQKPTQPQAPVVAKDIKI